MRPLIAILPLTAAVEAVNVVSMNIARHSAAQGKITNLRRLGKRGTVTETLLNNVTAGSYLATIQVGTPGQAMTLALDTGSSDLWVLGNDAEVCENDGSSFRSQDPGESCSFGTFDSNASSTFKDIIPNGFEIQYQDNSQAVGDYFTDDLTFGGAKIKNLQMGLGSGSTTVNLGIMGIGYDTDEAANQDGDPQYQNVIDVLVSQGLINTKAYSLYLDDLFASSGSILFGGIDTAKYTGSLISVPIQPDASSGESIITSFTIPLTSLTSKNGSSTSSLGSSLDVPVILDSGTTLSYIPNDLAAKLYEEIGAVDDSVNIGAVFVDCSVNTSDASINYQFGGSKGPVISVGISQLLNQVPADAFEGSGEDAPFGDNTCQFGIMPGDPGPYLLGDSFLRSAYVVYDLKNNEIGLAQTSFNKDESNVVEIPSSASGIPLVSGVATGATVTQTATGQLGIGHSTGSSPSTTGITTSASSSDSISSSFSSLSFLSSVSAPSAFSSVSSPLSSTGISSSSSSSSSKSASGTSQATSQATSQTTSQATSIPTFNFSGLFVLAVSGLFSLLGGAWFIL